MTPLSIPHDRTGRRVRRHAGELLRLAAPVVVARAGLMTMAAVDTVMVGRYGAEELAHYGLGATPMGVLMSSGVGLLLGTAVLAAHALGAGDRADAGAAWRRAVPYALLIGFVQLLLCLLAEPFFLLTGQAPELAAGGGAVLEIVGLGLPGAMLFTATTMFLEALKRPTPGMVAMIAANLLNVLLNWLLVFGNWGLPALGAEGAAWATTILRWLMAVGLIAYVWFMPDRDAFGVRARPPGGWHAAGRLRRIGYAAGVSQALESSAFMALGLFAGLLGALPLAAYTIAFNLLALPFMAAVGLATATGVRVGHAYGRRDWGEVAFAGWTGLGVTSVLLAAVGTLYAVLPWSIAAWFTDDARLLAIAAPLVAFSAWILVVDGGQNVMATALRGRGDTWIPTALHFVSYYAVMVPASWVLAFSLGHGVRGLFEGVLIASVVSVGVLSVRFAVLGARDRRA